MVVRRLTFVPVFVSFVACVPPTSPDAASSASEEGLSNGDDPDMTGPPEATTTSSSDPASSSDDGTTAAEPSTTGGESTGVGETTGAPEPEQPELPADLTPGFINVFWYLPQVAGGYDDASLDIHPAVSGPDDGTLQYFSFGGWQFTQGPPGNGFYGGLQTRMGNQTPASGYRGVIFSAWGVVDAIPAPGAYVDVDEVACDGGVGAVCVQLSLVYDWSSGNTYRMHYRLVGDAPGSPGNQLLRASVTDLTTGVESVLGDVVIPIAWGKLPAEYYSFDETFPEPEGALCTNYNPSDVYYTNLVAQSATVVADSWAQGDPAYTGPCIDLFHYDPQPDGYRMRLGIYEAGS